MSILAPARFSLSPMMRGRKGKNIFPLLLLPKREKSQSPNLQESWDGVIRNAVGTYATVGCGQVQVTWGQGGLIFFWQNSFVSLKGSMCVHICVWVSLSLCMFMCRYMHVSICWQVCMCLCIAVYIWVYMYLSICVFGHVSVYTCMCLSVCMCWCQYICLHAYVCQCMFIYMCLYICMYAIVYLCDCPLCMFMHAFKYTCVCVCDSVSLYMCVSTHACMGICLYVIYVSLWFYLCMSLFVYMCICTSLGICIYIYLCMFLYVYMCICASLGKYMHDCACTSMCTCVFMSLCTGVLPVSDALEHGGFSSYAVPDHNTQFRTSLGVAYVLFGWSFPLYWGEHCSSDPVAGEWLCSSLLEGALSLVQSRICFLVTPCWPYQGPLV